MAFKVGLKRFFGFLRPRWGVRGSLFVAFAVIAGMAIVISAGAGLVLRHLGSSMVDLSGRDIPRLAASLQLAAQSAGLAIAQSRYVLLRVVLRPLRGRIAGTAVQLHRRHIARFRSGFFRMMLCWLLGGLA